MREIDEGEERAERYLRHQGYVDIERQPEGNGKFPDFLVDGRIGVEVRRLNINTIDEDRDDEDRALVSTTNGAHAVSDLLDQVLSTFGASPSELSWYVRAQFKRPFINPRRLKPAIQRALKSFLENPQKKALIEIAENFKLEVWQASGTFPSCFLNGAYDDLDNLAFWMEYERERNLNLCIEEKTLKRNKGVLKRTYSEWWLIFIDAIGYGADFAFPERMNIKHDWDRVILIDPVDPTKGYRIP